MGAAPHSKRVDYNDYRPRLRKPVFVMRRGRIPIVDRGMVGRPIPATYDPIAREALTKDEMSRRVTINNTREYWLYDIGPGGDFKHVQHNGDDSAGHIGEPPDFVTQWKKVPMWLKDPLSHFKTWLVDIFKDPTMRSTSDAWATVSEEESKSHHIVLTLHDKRIDVARFLARCANETFKESLMTDIYVPSTELVASVGYELRRYEWNRYNSMTRNVIDERSSRYKIEQSTACADVIICYNGVNDHSFKRSTKRSAEFQNTRPLVLVDVFIGPRAIPVAPTAVSGPARPPPASLSINPHEYT